MKFVRLIVMCTIAILLIGVIWGPIHKGSAMELHHANNSIDEAALVSTPSQLIRFHVLANSDSEQDQALKHAVRDAILKELSPQLAVAQSLDESRQILKKVRPDMERIGRSVVKVWGKEYMVHTEYGHFAFPTKSYGSIVLPAGEYEALRVVIGEGQGANWWCVLFPPLCFIDIDHSTAVQVDEKVGIPLNNKPTVYSIKETTKETSGSPKVRFYFLECIKRFFTL